MQFREIIRPSSTTAGGPDIYYKMSAAAGNLSIFFFIIPFSPCLEVGSKKLQNITQ